MSEGPDILSGEFVEEEIGAILSYSQDLNEKLYIAIAIANRTLEIQPALPPHDPFNAVYMKAYLHLTDERSYRTFNLLTERGFQTILVEVKDL